MPGLVTPPEAPPLRIAVPEERRPQIRSPGEDPEPAAPKSRSPAPKRAPSPSPFRAKPSPDRLSSARKRGSPGEKPLLDESALDNPDLGPFLLKLARDTIASGEGPGKALEYAIRASRSFERCAQEGREPSLELAMSLHVTAAIYCSLGRYEEALPVLERSLRVPEIDRGADHALAAFSGYMQLGDTYSMLGRIDQAIACYTEGLGVQMRALGDTDPRVAETCRYMAEAYVQAMQFDEAEKLCQKTLDIHIEHSARGSLEEAADRRLMALICEANGNNEAALEHLVLASMVMIDGKQDNEVAAIDISIGNIYLSLGRFDEAVFAYQKALTVFKSTKGDNHPMVASVFVRLADLYYKTGKLRESKSYCENALRIYSKPVPGTSAEEIAGGLTDISAIFEAMNEPEEALRLLQKALNLLEDSPGQHSTIAGIEAQMGVICYMVGRYSEARSSFQSALSKLRASGERKSAFFGVVLNQMGLVCVQLYKTDEAAELFEEARGILEQVCGPYHQDTLGVYSNLAATYDALGRVEDAIEVLEYVLKLREEKLGTANPDVDDEKKRLAELLKEAGRNRNRKAKSLENLLDTNAQRVKKEGTRRWSGLGFRT
uniref:Nephrocystin-3 n=1 Tax=Anthurium amnicola TaxID=1678845 RepID=A0A1D1XTQ9_9ARAE